MDGLLRHLVATIEYRLRIVIVGAPEHFGDLDVGYGVRKPREILSHIAGLLRGVDSVLNEKERTKIEPGTWDQEVERFYSAARALDSSLTGKLPEKRVLEKLLQGPLCDALTHVGQLSMMRRMAGKPVEGVNFFKADITKGKFLR